MKFQATISTRVAVCATFVLSAVGVAVTWVVYSPHQQILRETQLEKLSAISEEQHQGVVSSIQRLREDVRFLAGTPPIEGILRARQSRNLVDPVSGDSEQEWKGRLEAIFTSFLKRRSEYSQVRLIALDDAGLELVRVDRPAPNLFVPVRGDELQRKAAAEYVRVGRTLPPHSVLLSEIDVNREYEQVSVPLTPIIRASTPVFGSNGEALGLIVVNHDLSYMFDGLQRGRPRGSELLLTNDSGHYLLHTERQSALGFEVGRPRRLQDEVPELGEFYDDKTGKDRGLFEFEQRHEETVKPYAISMMKIRFDPTRRERYVALGLYASYGALLGESREVGRASAAAAVLLILTGSGLLLFYIRRAMQPLKLIVRSTERVAAGDYDVELPEDSADEIGQLAGSFRSMLRQVQERNAKLEHRAREIAGQKEVLRVANEELAGAHHELEIKAEQLDRANRQKTEFLARISHDLRGPLNNMMALAEEFASNRAGNLTGSQQEASRVTLESGRDLLAMINDLLDLSKAEAGKLTAHREAADLRSLIRHVRVQFQPLANSRRLELRSDVSAEVPARISTDPRLLRQILHNLISNALKYTERGSVSLSADIDREVSPHRLRIEVSDTGPGIPADRLERLFQPYERLERDVRSERSGTGLGLSIVRGLTETLGGEVRVDSTLGRGSRFRLLLPLEPVANPVGPSQGPVETGPLDDAILAGIHAPDSAQELAEQPGALEPPPARRILIADDDPATRLILQRRVASGPEAQAELVDNGLDALAAIRRTPFHAAIIDLNIPGADGWEILESLREDPPHRPPKMILYTGAALTRDQQKTAAELGAEVVMKDGSKEAFERLRVLAVEGSAEGLAELRDGVAREGAGPSADVSAPAIRKQPQAD